MARGRFVGWVSRSAVYTEIPAYADPSNNTTGPMIQAANRHIRRRFAIRCIGGSSLFQCRTNRAGFSSLVF
jgi:hypothetical protein